MIYHEYSSRVDKEQVANMCL